MASTISQFLKNKTVTVEGEELELSVDLITMLHNWNFGTSKSWYKNPNKKLIIPNAAGRLVEINNISQALDQVMQAYDEYCENEIANVKAKLLTRL